MRTTTRLASGPGFVVEDVRIRAADTAWWRPEVSTGYRLTFVRSGVFRLRWRQWDVLADPAMAYVRRPGDEQRIAHRVGVDDLCTSVTLSAPLLPGAAEPPAGPVFTGGRTDLAHRALVARARTGASTFELTERVALLVADLVDHPDQRPGASAGRRIVEAARELLTDDPVTLGLPAVARRIGVSPSHLSRTFRRETGQTLTRFRNRLRVRRALDRISRGERDLAGLAVSLGFADHAHLTRTLRAEVGSTPSAVRDLLAGRLPRLERKCR